MFLEASGMIPIPYNMGGMLHSNCLCILELWLLPSLRQHLCNRGSGRNLKIDRWDGGLTCAVQCGDIYIVIIDELCRKGNIVKVNELSELMIKRSVNPNIVAYNMLIDEHCKKRKIDLANELFELMIDRGVNLHMVTYNKLIHGLCLINGINNAKELFVPMTNHGYRHNVIIFRIMINGYDRKQT
ncbi:hypothetical protein ACOSQ3_022293 [Xanthoceras sorbifolium]